MSDQYTTYQPQPGASSQEGAYMQNPQQPSYYFKDANQYGAADAPSATAYSGQSYVGTGVEPASSSTLGSWFDFSRPEYLKGLLLGAGVALVATNPKVQKAVVSGAVKLWAAVQGGVEEIKEQVQDAKAELSREE